MADLLYILWAVVLSWRFFLALALASVAIIVVFSLIPDRAICAVISGVIALAALVVGFVWQWRAARGRSFRA